MQDPFTPVVTDQGAEVSGVKDFQKNFMNLVQYFILYADLEDMRAMEKNANHFSEEDALQGLKSNPPLSPEANILEVLVRKTRHVPEEGSGKPHSNDEIVISEGYSRVSLTKSCEKAKSEDQLTGLSINYI